MTARKRSTRAGDTLVLLSNRRTSSLLSISQRKKLTRFSLFPFFSWNDELNPNDPVAEDGKAAGSGTATPAEPEFKTLDEYLASRPNLDERFRRKEARAANEGVDESQWKDAVPLQRNKEDDVYYGGKVTPLTQFISFQYGLFLIFDIIVGNGSETTQ